MKKYHDNSVIVSAISFNEFDSFVKNNINSGHDIFKFKDLYVDRCPDGYIIHSGAVKEMFTEGKTLIMYDNSHMIIISSENFKDKYSLFNDNGTHPFDKVFSKTNILDDLQDMKNFYSLARPLLYAMSLLIISLFSYIIYIR